jgi:hypothetical protein
VQTSDRLLAVANGYLESVGLPRIPDRRDVVAPNEARARGIASAYAALPTGPPRDYRSHHAYQSFKLEVKAQFDYLIRAGFAFYPCGSVGEMDYPYFGSNGVIQDARNGNLWVFSGGDDHPTLTRHENWMFRCVHDVFGHALHGYSLGPIGEENTYRSHARMFSYDALPALTVETRGQNSWFHFGPYADLPMAVRPYAEQRANLLPSWAQLMN